MIGRIPQLRCSSSIARTSLQTIKPARWIRPTLVARQPTRLPQHRLASSFKGGLGGDRKGFRVSYLFGGLVGVGLLVTIYGLLEYYYSLQTWPEQVRTPLKAAIKARNSGDFDRSESYFRKAIEAAMALPATSLEPDPLLKLSGLYITMSSMFETTYQPIKAFSSLREALPHFGEDALAKDVKYRISNPWAGSRPLSEEEHKRVIGITQKLGQMALQLSSTRVPPPFPVVEGKSPKDWDQAAEEYLSSALTAMLRLGLKPGKAGEVAVAGRDVDLPEGSEGDDEGASGRVDKRGLGMTMEALSEVYARRGQYDLAGNLLLQAVSTLLPPQSKEPPPMRDRCQAAMLMTTISSHAIQSSRTEQAIKASKSWSLRSLQIAQQALKENGDQVTDSASATCARAKTVGLQNMGMLAEIEGDKNGALKYFNQALEAAKDTSFAEARREATQAIRRLSASSDSA